jgi:16S rRNA C1402 N4-methylase RsmH
MGGPASGGVSAFDVVNEYPTTMLASILTKVRTAVRMVTDAVAESADLLSAHKGRPKYAVKGVTTQLGEERHAFAIATAIDRARRKHPIRTTVELADLVASVVPARAASSAKARNGPVRRIHPATRTFQALRIFVNREVRWMAL